MNELIIGGTWDRLIIMTQTAGMQCPKCKSYLNFKKASKGIYQGKVFFACPRFPKCKYIMNIPDSEQAEMQKKYAEINKEFIQKIAEKKQAQIDYEQNSTAQFFNYMSERTNTYTTHGVTGTNNRWSSFMGLGIFLIFFGGFLGIFAPILFEIISLLGFLCFVIGMIGGALL